jgi:hypothetical protein
MAHCAWQPMPIPYTTGQPDDATGGPETGIIGGWAEATEAAAARAAVTVANVATRLLRHMGDSLLCRTAGDRRCIVLPQAAFSRPRRCVRR